ncbi:MAG: PAS domain-containing protein [Chitinophagaceae bacterium]
MLTLVTSVDGFSMDLLDQVNDAVIALDNEFRIVYSNAAAAKLYELISKNGLGKRLSELHVFQYAEGSRDTVLQTLIEQKAWKGEMSFINGAGEQIHLLSSVNEYYKDGIKVGYIGISKDITALKISSHQLEQTLAHNQQMLDGISEGIVLYNRDGAVVSCNRNAEHILEMDQSTLGQWFLPPIEWHVYRKDMSMVLLTEHPIYKAFQSGHQLRNQVIGIEINERIKWLSLNISPVLDPGKSNPVAAAISFRDISRQVELEQKVSQSETLFKSFMNNTPSLNWITAEDGTILFFNRKYLRDFRFDSKAIGRNIYELYPHQAAAEFERNNLEVLKQNRTIIAVEKIVYPKGKTRSFLVMKFPLRMSDNTLAIGGTGMDITEQLEMEETLRNQQLSFQKDITRATIEAQEKERAEIGRQLHESVGQILSTTKLYIDLQLKEGAINAELLSKSTKYLSDAIEEIRFLSGALTPQVLRDIGITASIRELTDPLISSGKLMVELDIDENADEASDIDSKLTILRIIQEQLNNIVRHSQAALCRISLRQKGSRLTLSITDDGIGFIPELEMNSGLSNIKYRVDSYRGDFNLDAAPGKGCTLRVSLPVS